MTNGETKTVTGTMETKVESMQTSVYSTVELISADITMIHSLKNLVGKTMEAIVMPSESVQTIQSLKELADESMKALIGSFESIQLLLLKLTEEMEGDSLNDQ